MANRVFQSVIYQMKDAINRVVGVVDETGAVISCSELNLIGEVREGYMAERLTAGDRFVRDGYTYQQFSNAKHNDYAVFVEGVDETAGQFAGVLDFFGKNEERKKNQTVRLPRRVGDRRMRDSSGVD